MSGEKRKTEGEICPYCGSEYTEVEEREINLGLDANGEIRTYLFEHRTCTDCHEQFTDYYLIEYDGYYANGTDYDRNGEIMPE